MRLDEFQCDICSAPKREANHWFVAWESFEEIRFMRWAVAAFNYEPPDPIRMGDDPRHADAHLCGHECLHRWIDQKLSEGEVSAQEDRIAKA